MIVFGTAVTRSEEYDRCVRPGLRRAAEPDSVVLANQSAGSLFRTYNVLLDQAAAYEDLEALVLLHQDVEIVSDDFPLKLREALSDPDVAIVGCAGSVGTRSIAWWQGSLKWASLTHRYTEYGGGDFPAVSWRPTMIPSFAEPGQVDSIDGFVICMSPWAVRNLRFDESLGKLHGYDFDICMQAKAAGKKVMAVDFRAIHHRGLDLIRDPENWINAFVTLSEKWEHLLPDTGADPNARAVRADAEAACARAIMVAHQMKHTAIQRQLARLERDLEIAREDHAAARAQLAAVSAELAAARAEAAPGAEEADAPAEQGPPPLPAAGRFAPIDHAIEQLGIRSFASLEIGQAAGQYAFHAIDKPGVVSGALLDAGGRRRGDHLLNALDLASEHAGMRIVDGDFWDPDVIADLGRLRRRAALRGSAPHGRAGLGRGARALRAVDVGVRDPQPAVAEVRGDRPAHRPGARGVPRRGPALARRERAVRPPRRVGRLAAAPAARRQPRLPVGHHRRRPRREAARSRVRAGPRLDVRPVPRDERFREQGLRLPAGMSGLRCLGVLLCYNDGDLLDESI